MSDFKQGTMGFKVGDAIFLIVLIASAYNFIALEPDICFVSSNTI